MVISDLIFVFREDMVMIFGFVFGYIVLSNSVVGIEVCVFLIQVLRGYVVFVLGLESYFQNFYLICKNFNQFKVQGEVLINIFIKVLDRFQV